MKVNLVIAMICVSFHTTYGCFKSLLDLQERLHEASDASNDNDQGNIDFCCNGKFCKLS